MSSRGAVAFSDHPKAKAPMRRRGRWLTRLFLLLFSVAVVLPVSLILLFRIVPPPLTPLMWVRGGAIKQSWVPLDAISPNLIHAVIASEDTKFCSHSGFDFDAIDQALDDNAAGGRLRGASTISQQTAKNLFLLPERNWVRKGVEAYLTLLLEGLWPKRRILETYLNIIEWGPAEFGAQAAAEANFGKPARELTANEAARLATVLPSPKRYRVEPPGPFVARQARIVQARMAQVTRDRLDACVFR